MVAAALFLATGYGLVWRLDPETGGMFFSFPRDILYQLHTALGGVLLAAGVSYFLPIDWTRGDTPGERIAANLALAIIWATLIYAMARH